MSPVTKFLTLVTAASVANAYWLMGIENFITTERLDPIVNPGTISSHVHSVLGGSNFAMTTDTAKLRQSQCTSIPIAEDKSNYWFPHLYFQWANGNFSSLTGGAVIYYLFDDKPGTTTAFPDDVSLTLAFPYFWKDVNLAIRYQFRMLSGSPLLRTYDSNSFAQQAVTFLCLDFNGQTTRHSELPNKVCPSGVRAQINFPNCWDGKNTDSPDHKSHVAFQANGPDTGGCKDPKFPITLPRIFIEVYWDTNKYPRDQAMNKDQPLVFSHGDPTGYGYHADFINGWDAGVLQKAVDGCNCNIYGDPKCCNDKGIFTLTKDKKCYITPTVDETTTGMLTKLPGNNPVQPAGKTATMFPETSRPALLAPVRVYTDANNPAPRGQVVTPGSNGDAGVRTSSTAAASTSAASSSVAPASSPIVVKPASSTPAAASSAAPVPTSPDAGNTFIAIPSSSGGATSPAVTGSASSTPAPAPTSSTPSPANDNQDGDDDEDCDEDDDDEPAAPSGSSSAVPAPKPTATPSTTSPDAGDDAGDDEDCDEDEPSSPGSSPSSVPTPATSSPASTNGDADDEDCDDEEPSTPASSSPVSKPTSAPSSSDSGADDEDCDDDDKPSPAPKPSASSSPAKTDDNGDAEDCDDTEPSSPTTTPASPAPTVILAPAPAASSAAPANGSNSYKISYKNGVKCKVRDSSGLGKQFNQYVKRDFSKAVHGHARRPFSHDLSAGRRRFAQSRMQAL
ncbi:hypothetical protein PLEOSDRAFT_1085920 [Pleurotus ostreatus PC15]|uniref:DUF1996 domain-containing protein n=1 Tax=Pleurotus ostreatus (strain PC15) TaxID=1137138 RepID=A0A067NAN9_PLEO1|nr:hypothetical protein PLEOSDRAFT_1085920 [Pleurotus ostreatus PC15]